VHGSQRVQAPVRLSPSPSQTGAPLESESNAGPRGRLIGARAPGPARPGTSSAARRGPTRPRRGRRLWENDSDPYDSDPGHPAAAQRTDTPQTRMAPSV
jgi:hypothetical protein